jgi:hypothetical protein
MVELARGARVFLVSWHQQWEAAVFQWEYRKIDLTAARGDRQEIQWLNQAGAEGWELVRVTDNNVAYLKREMASKPPAKKAAEEPGLT